MTKRANPKNLLNFSEISRLCSGTRAVIKSTYCPKKHQSFLTDLINAIKGVMKKHGYEAEGGE